MTDASESVLPFSDLNQQTQRLVEQVQATKRPLIIVRDGQSAAVLVEAQEYEQQTRRLALMERIARGKQDIAAGRTHTQEEVEALLDEWLAGDKLNATLTSP
jgi:prevent-host-death family protein